jgi:hypothetical protein
LEITDNVLLPLPLFKHTCEIFLLPCESVVVNLGAEPAARSEISGKSAVEYPERAHLFARRARVRGPKGRDA